MTARDGTPPAASIVEQCCGSGLTRRKPPPAPTPLKNAATPNALEVAAVRQPQACSCKPPDATPWREAAPEFRARPDTAGSALRNGMYNLQADRHGGRIGYSCPRGECTLDEHVYPSPTIRAVSSSVNAAIPLAAASRLSAAQRSGTECTSVPSRSNNSVGAAMRSSKCKLITSVHRGFDTRAAISLPEENRNREP